MKLFYIFLAIFCSSLLNAQDCPSIEGGSSHTQGNLKANLLKSGEVYNQLFIKNGIGEDGSLDSRVYTPLIYSENIWIGGKTRAQSLNMAGGLYNKQDWTAGNLNYLGLTNSDKCDFYNQVFTVTKQDILKAIEITSNNGSCDDIPSSILNWPAKENPFLNYKDTDLSRVCFFDNDSDGIYNPCQGDLPTIPDQNVDVGMDFDMNTVPCSLSLYLINDNGSKHSTIETDAVKMDVEVYTFSYDIQELEDVIFTSYKYNNHGNEDLSDFYFSFWNDFEIGCKENDLLGCYPDYNMVYAYNNGEEICGQDAFEKEVPMIGISVLKGPDAPFIFANVNGKDTLLHPYLGSGIVDTVIEVGISSVSIPVDCFGQQCLPSYPTEFYNIMRGENLNGTPILDLNGNITSFPFNDDPSDPNGYNMCHSNEAPHTSLVSSFGPIIMQPGSINRIIKATIVTKDVDPSCPSIEPLLYKTKKAQDFYDKNFYNVSGPNAPNLQFEKVSDGIQISISDIPYNYLEPFEYEPQVSNPNYTFEGIKIYQVKSLNFDMTELENNELSYLLYQGDVSNNISNIYNWKPDFDGGTLNFVLDTKVIGNNNGIESEILFKYDYLNEKPYDPDQIYYFVAVSYAHNNYKSFDIATQEGQQYPYIETSCCKKVLRSDRATAVTNLSIEDDYSFKYAQNEFQIYDTKIDLKVTLFDIQGRATLDWHIRKNEDIKSENLSYLQTGIYFVNVHNVETGQNASHKILIIN